MMMHHTHRLHRGRCKNDAKTGYPSISCFFELEQNRGELTSHSIHDSCIILNERKSKIITMFEPNDLLGKRLLDSFSHGGIF